MILSLRIIIGNGEGRNWWCVLYPPLCLDSSSVKEELAEAGFNKNQISFITESDSGGYTLKFKIAESISEAAKKLKNLFR